MLHLYLRCGRDEVTETRHKWQVPPRSFLVALVLVALAQFTLGAPAVQSTTSLSQPVRLMGEDLRRFQQFSDLLLEMNPPKARRTGARELINSSWPQAVDLLVSSLQNEKDPVAQMAVIDVIAETAAPHPRFLEPLLTLLGSKDERMREGAAAALATFKGPEVVERLGQLARGIGPARPDLAKRLAAIRSLAQMTENRDAMDVLVGLIGDTNAEVRDKANAAVRDAAGIELDSDAFAVRRWWQSNRDRSVQDRLRDRVRVLSLQNRQLRKELAGSQAVLVATLRDLYLLKPDAQKPDTLMEYLKHPLEDVRLLGLDLIGAILTDRKPVPDSVLRRLRSLVVDASPKVRQKVVLTLRDLHSAGDAEVILAQYRQETDGAVRAAMLNALGRLRSPKAIDLMIEALSSDDRQVMVEGALSLGVLGEKGSASPEKIAPAVTPLIACYRKLASSDAQLREQFLEAMSMIADPQFAPIFIDALTGEKEATVRQAAARGIAAMGNPDNADLLVRQLGDLDAGVRRTVVESLARIAKTDVHLEALFARLDAKNESDATVRDKAWEGIRQILRTRPLEEQRRWVKRIPPQEGKASAEQTVELLTDIEKQLAMADPSSSDLQDIREELGDALTQAGQYAEAARVYRLVYEDLRKGRKSDAWDIGVKLFTSRLQSDRYDEAMAIADELGRPATAKQREHLAEILYDHLSTRMKTAEPDKVLEVLERVGDRAEGGWKARFAQLRGQAEQLRSEQDVATVRRCIAQLRGDPTDVERAQQQVRALGVRAIVPLAEELKAVITSSEADPIREKQILDLLTPLASPRWKGYAEKADRAAKLRAIDDLSKPAS